MIYSMVFPVYEQVSRFKVLSFRQAVPVVTQLALCRSRRSLSLLCTRRSSEDTRNMQIAACFLGLAALVAGHGYVDNATIGGTYYQVRHYI